MSKIRKPVIRINMKTNEIKEYVSQTATKLDGFNETKVSESCRISSRSHKGFFWCFKNDYRENLLYERLILNRKPHRYKKYNDIDIKNKICYVCNINKEIIEFHREKKGVGGRRGECKKFHHKRLNDRKKNNPLIRLKCNLRKRLNSALKVKKWNKNNYLTKYLGCSFEELKIYLESKFKPGMTWIKISTNDIHIDHIIPLSYAQTEDEMYKLCHYTNLQPLWNKDHLLKTIEDLRRVG